MITCANCMNLCGTFIQQYLLTKVSTILLSVSFYFNFGRPVKGGGKMGL